MSPLDAVVYRTQADCPLSWRPISPPCLTHWGRVMHICFSKLNIIGSDNGLSPGQCQAIIWTNTGMLFIGPIGTNFSEILIKIYTFSFRKMQLKMSSGKWHPFCLGLNVLTHWGLDRMKWYFPGDILKCILFRKCLYFIHSFIEVSS